jgi:hypothetical protein
MKTLSLIALIVFLAACVPPQETVTTPSDSASEQQQSPVTKPLTQQPVALPPVTTTSAPPVSVEQSTLVVVEYPCPELSVMKLEGYNNLFQSWTAQVFPYKSGNLEVVYTYNSQIEENRKIIYCDAGSKEGQNANWVYCGDFLRPIVAQYADSKGVILKTRTIEVTFDKNTKQYLNTQCDTYPHI